MIMFMRTSRCSALRRGREPWCCNKRGNVREKNRPSWIHQVDSTGTTGGRGGAKPRPIPNPLAADASVASRRKANPTLWESFVRPATHGTYSHR